MCQSTNPFPEDVPFDEIVFTTRRTITGDGHWYANFSYYAGDPQKKLYLDGSQLTKFHIKTGKTTVLLDDPQGTIRDPVVDYNGKTIVFSYRKGGTETFHLYEIESDGSNLRQLTGGAYDDIEPCFLPDGDIIFVSSRGRRWVNCWLTQVATLHRCDRNGSNIRMISANIEHDNTPWVLNDGRIAYTRWEYVDRSQVDYHQLWAANPDGTNQTVYFGNMNPGGVFIDAKPIPASERVVFIYSPGHGRTNHAGRIATVTDQFGPDHTSAIEFITEGINFWDPYPISDNLFLAASGNQMVLVTSSGYQFDLYKQPKIPSGSERIMVRAELHEPRPLQARQREPVIASRVDTTQSTGSMILTDVYNGRNMQNVERGSIKKLLVLETLPKPINYTGGMDPLSYGGTFTLERIMGTIPVEEDGSAYFELPALRSIFFIALDENENSVKRMHSFTSIMPGETLGCVGCHEDRMSTPQNTRGTPMLLALKKPASKIEPVKDIPDVYDYPRDIQPLLDKYCVSCHQPSNRSGDVVLTGDHGPMFSLSYFMLTIHQQMADGRNRVKSNYPPYTIGASASPLMEKIQGNHHQVMFSKDEIRRVRYWIESGAAYPGTYAALGGGAIGGYYQNTQLVNNDTQWPESMKASKVINKRCTSCHKENLRIPNTLTDENEVSFWRPDWDDPKLNRVRHVVFNLSEPEHSLMLMAPLSLKEGGYGSCREILPDGSYGDPVEIFKNKNDRSYQTILSMIRAGKDRLEEVTRFDMPHFRPHPAYFREMKRYGILPADFDQEKDSYDVYQLDRLYWDSFIYLP